MGRLNEELREKTNKEYRNFADCKKALEKCSLDENKKYDILKETTEQTYKKYAFFGGLKKAISQAKKKEDKNEN